MGVYVKGMEMPKNCRECFACKAELSQEKKVIYVCCFAMADCPLVHVPEHGRLIDADALEASCFMGSSSFYTQSDIDYAPTIIQAEEGE